MYRLLTTGLSNGEMKYTNRLVVEVWVSMNQVRGQISVGILFKVIAGCNQNRRHSESLGQHSCRLQDPGEALQQLASSRIISLVRSAQVLRRGIPAAFCPQRIPCLPCCHH